MSSIQRYNHISTAKGIGIIMVVIAHSFASPNIVTNFICLFHMPLFFFLSGYCFNDKYINDIVTFVKRSIKTLYVPFVAANLLFIALHNYFFDINIYNDVYGFLGTVSIRYVIDDYIQKIIYTFRFMGQEQLLGGFWLLKSLFFARLIFLFVRVGETKCFSTIRLNLYRLSILMLLMLFCLKDYRIPGVFGSMEVFGSLMIMGGYYFKKYDDILQTYALHFILICIVICVIYTLFRPLYYSSAPLTWERADYVIPAFSGCIATYFICKGNWFCNLAPIRYIGSHTLIILAFHFLSFKLVSYGFLILKGDDMRKLAQFAVLKDTNLFLTAFYVSAGIFMPLLIRYIYRIT